MCEEESDDSEAVAKLLEINDSIHRTIERYKLVKKGDLEAASQIPKGTLGTSTGVTKTGDNELSLIDFGGDVEPNASGEESVSGPVPKVASIEDDLLGLSMQDQNYGQTGGIALGFGANSSESFLAPSLSEHSSNTGIVDVPGPSLLSSATQENSAKSPMPQPFLQQQQTPAPPKPNYDPFSSLSSHSYPSSRSTTPAATSLFQGTQPQPHSQTTSDPFALLSSSNSRNASPLPRQTQIPPSSSSTSISNFSSTTAPGGQTSHGSGHKTNGASAEEDWDFASALPDEGLPTANAIMVSNTLVNITFEISRTDKSGDVVAIMARFSNNTPNLITEYTFQVAVTKV